MTTYIKTGNKYTMKHGGTFAWVLLTWKR